MSENLVDLDGLSARELFEALQKAAADCFPRDRDQFVVACPLSPANLIGSYFRAPDPADPNAEAAWLEGDRSCATIEGVIVAQPYSTEMTAVYLVEFVSREGGRGYQQLVAIDRMLEQRWLFYDDKGWLSGWAPDGEAPANAREALRQEHAKEQ